MTKVGGFNVMFSHRGAWTADLLAPGKAVEVVPVTWIKDWDRVAGTVFVWLKKAEDVARYTAMTNGFRVAIARYNEDGSAASDDIVGIFFVTPIQASQSPLGVLCKMVGRVQASDR